MEDLVIHYNPRALHVVVHHQEVSNNLKNLKMKKNILLAVLSICCGGGAFYTSALAQTPTCTYPCGTKVDCETEHTDCVSRTTSTVDFNTEGSWESGSLSSTKYCGKTSFFGDDCGTGYQRCTGQ